MTNNGRGTRPKLRPAHGWYVVGCRWCACAGVCSTGIAHSTAPPPASPTYSTPHVPSPPASSSAAMPSLDSDLTRRPPSATSAAGTHIPTRLPTMTNHLETESKAPRTNNAFSRTITAGCQLDGPWQHPDTRLEHTACGGRNGWDLIWAQQQQRRAPSEPWHLNPRLPRPAPRRLLPLSNLMSTRQLPTSFRKKQAIPQKKTRHLFSTATILPPPQRFHSPA